MVIKVCLKTLYLIQLKCPLKVFLETEFSIATATFFGVRICSSGCGFSFKVTVHVGTDQNIEIEIFAEDKCTLNKLLVTKIVFQYV